MDGSVDGGATCGLDDSCAGQARHRLSHQHIAREAGPHAQRLLHILLLEAGAVYANTGDSS